MFWRYHCLMANMDSLKSLTFLGWGILRAYGYRTGTASAGCSGTGKNGCYQYNNKKRTVSVQLPSMNAFGPFVLNRSNDSRNKMKSANQSRSVDGSPIFGLITNYVGLSGIYLIFQWWRNSKVSVLRLG